MQYNTVINLVPYLKSKNLEIIRELGLCIFH